MAASAAQNVWHIRQNSDSSRDIYFLGGHSDVNLLPPITMIIMASYVLATLQRQPLLMPSKLLLAQSVPVMHTSAAESPELCSQS